MIELHVEDFEKIERFYARLGFEIVWKQAPDGHKGYLVMKMEDNVLRFWCGSKDMHDHIYFKRFPVGSPLGKGVEIVLTCQHLDALYERVKDEDFILEPLREKPWGLRDFRLRDPYGYYLRITTPHDILSGADWIIP